MPFLASLPEFSPSAAADSVSAPAEDEAESIWDKEEYRIPKNFNRACTDNTIEYLPTTDVWLEV